MYQVFSMYKTPKGIQSKSITSDNFFAEPFSGFIAIEYIPDLAQQLFGEDTESQFWGFCNIYLKQEGKTKFDRTYRQMYIIDVTDITDNEMIFACWYAPNMAESYIGYLIVKWKENKILWFIEDLYEETLEEYSGRIIFNAGEQKDNSPVIKTPPVKAGKGKDILIASAVCIAKNNWEYSEWQEVNIRIDWDTKTGKIKFGEPFDLLSCIVTKQDDFKNPTEEVEHMIVCTAFSSLGNKLMLQFNFNADKEICFLTVMYYDKDNKELSKSGVKFAINYEDIFSTN